MKLLKIFAATSLVMLGACASELNEGQVRIGVPQMATGNDGAGTVTPEVFRSTSGAVINENDDFMITLISTYICDFREAQTLEFLSPTNSGAIACGDERSAGTNTRGEIAILAGFGFRDENGTGGVPEERLVFLSDDVRETGQLLNFVNLPIYGPARYKFATSRLRMTILELDQEEAEEQSTFLQAVADAGASFSTPIEGKVIEVLASIGDALIKSNKDDREMRFDVGFDVPFSTSKTTSNQPKAAPTGTVEQTDLPAPGTDSNVTEAVQTESTQDNTKPETQSTTGTLTQDELPIMRFPLREGYLVLVRREKRDDKDHFKDIKVCPKLGLIVPAGDQCDGNNYVSNATWMLLRITKEDERVANATLNRTLRDALEARQGGGITAKDLTAIQNAVQSLTSDS